MFGGGLGQNSMSGANVGGDLGTLFESLMKGKSQEGSGGVNRKKNRMFGDGVNRNHKRREDGTAKATVTRSFFCSLEDLCNPEGCVKKLKVKSTVVNERTSQRTLQDKIYTINVKTGWKAGTQIKFKSADGFPPMTFILKEKRHPFLIREGNNLRYVCEITTRQAKNGARIQLPLPSGETFTISTEQHVPTQDGDCRRFSGKGMPMKNANGNSASRGDLIVEFRLKLNS
uniref:Chaperone DnaJ C-terminal domain-containing protein n=1 Tax=Proboscia inermis TaxID=420281 RepID=A0A7S0C0P4_9STRA|mmetsp:Transcript_20273/g.20542  ORF Transcript_20273/g.20542 Transcript_20273/m.20542 type:complete len:229 (+) Transcript_20273:217-903(+)